MRLGRRQAVTPALGLSLFPFVGDIVVCDIIKDRSRSLWQPHYFTQGRYTGLLNYTIFRIICQISRITAYIGAAEKKIAPKEGAFFVFRGRGGLYIGEGSIKGIPPRWPPAGADPGRTCNRTRNGPRRPGLVDNMLFWWTTRRITSQMFAFVNSSTPAPSYASTRPMITAAAAAGPAAATPAARPDHRQQPAGPAALARRPARRYYTLL